MALAVAAGLVLAAPASAPGAVPAGLSPPDADSPAELLGRPARAWSFDRWVRTRPLSLASLRGHVVLLRWFNEGCHYCKSTLPELESLRDRYGPDGLVVIAVYHPKPMRHVPDAHIARVASQLGFSGPLAVDERWTTLERWWLDGHPERNWTSVSFLIDRDGVVRWAHGGGEYHHSSDPRHAVCDATASELERTIRELLAGNASAAR